MKWSSFNNRRLSRKFARLLQKPQQLGNTNDQDKARIEEAKRICDRKRVYNLSGTNIPKETEELIAEDWVLIFNSQKENSHLLRLLRLQSYAPRGLRDIDHPLTKEIARKL